MNNRKILIISHNPINQTDNMGKTIGNIFSRFNKNELCQLYFKEQDICANNCENFICVDDKSMCKSIVNRFYKTCKIVENNYKIKQTSSIENNIVEYGRKKGGLVYLLRDLLWKIGKWNSRELNNWIKNQKVTSIFLFAGDYVFPFRIAMKIAKKYNIPVFVYFVDEYYRKEVGNQTIPAKIHKIWYRRKFRQIVRESKQYFCISESMNKLYGELFNKNGEVLMNTTEIVSNNTVSKEKTIISYIGNLGYNRWKSICDIGEEISKSKLNNIEFNVYSGETNPEIIKIMENAEGICFKGRINANEVKETIKNSDILVHVESFEKSDIDNVKYSVSTKIPDSLASGKILFVYGPKEVEAIDYIKRNNVGIVANQKDEIAERICSIVLNQFDKKSILKNAQELVKKYHRNDCVYNMLKKYLV